MEQAREELVALWSEAWRTMEVDPILHTVDPEIVVDWSNSIGPLHGIYHGVDELRKLFGVFGEAWSEVRWQVLETADFGPDNLLLTTRVDVRGRDSGVETTGRGAQLWTFDGPRVAAVKLFQAPDDGMAWLRRERLARARLYFVTDAGGAAAAGPALQNGADIVQLREKAPRCEEELVSFAEAFRNAAVEQGALFFLNDQPEAVAACGADGVHVGQDDSPVGAAREAAGPAALVGLSTHSPDQLDAACSAEGPDRPDYISVGPVWETPTKPGRPAAGLDYVRYAAANATLPWFAIGGIDAANVGDVVEAGAERVVVVRAIRDADDAAAAARRIREALPRG